MDAAKRHVLLERMPEARFWSVRQQEDAIDALDEIDLVTDIDVRIAPLMENVMENLDPDLEEYDRFLMRMHLRTIFLIGKAADLAERAEHLDGNSLPWEPLPGLEDEGNAE
jgi:hypothetical protein